MTPQRTTWGMTHPHQRDLADRRPAGETARSAVPMPWVADDGGRAAAGRAVDAGDCVARSIAIATELPYQTVYAALAALAGAAGGRRSARNGVVRKVYSRYLTGLGWAWTPTMSIGSGCTVHLRVGELPPGRLVVSLSKHMTAVVDGVVRDTYDPGRGGSRCVYGYWREPAGRTSQVPACRVCGCTEDRACLGGCEWVEADLCSACGSADLFGNLFGDLVVESTDAS